MEDKNRRGRPRKDGLMKNASNMKDSETTPVMLRINLDNKRLKKLKIVKIATGTSFGDMFIDLVNKRIDELFDDCKDVVSDFLSK